MWSEIFWLFLVAAAVAFGFAYGVGLAVAMAAGWSWLFKKLRRTKPKTHLSLCPDCQGTGFQLAESFTMFGPGAALLIKFPPVKCIKCAGMGFFSEILDAGEKKKRTWKTI